MKHLAVALLVATCLVLDFLADLWLGPHDNKGWDYTASWALGLGVLWFVMLGPGDDR